MTAKRYAKENLAQYLEHISDFCTEAVDILRGDDTERDIDQLKDDYWNLEVDDLILLVNDKIELVN